MIIDAVELTQRLIQCPSITPREGGALQLLDSLLSKLDFSCQRLDFEDVPNLYAKRGTGSPHFCFAGHTDVVPEGQRELWSHDPFSGVIENGKLWGRGAVDMKGAIACFISALAEFLNDDNFKGTISFLITGDEEGPAINGTQKMLKWLESQGELPEFCLIGEPTSNNYVGEVIKVGRRGSVTAELTCFGKQGHIAYPYFADNPIPRMLNCLNALQTHPLDKGSKFFEPSRLEITSIDVNNPVTNIIPAEIKARFGVRINDQSPSAHVSQWIRETCNQQAGAHKIDLTVHGDAFLTRDESLIQIMGKAVKLVTGTFPILNTTGGTSDGRFISAFCPVLECGLCEATMHQVDEHVPLQDLHILKNIYASILKHYWLSFSVSQPADKDQNRAMNLPK